MSTPEPTPVVMSDHNVVAFRVQCAAFAAVCTAPAHAEVCPNYQRAYR